MDSSTITERRQLQHEESVTLKSAKQAVEMEEDITHSKDDTFKSSSLSVNEQSTLHKPCDLLRCSNTNVTQCCTTSQINCVKHNLERRCCDQRQTQCYSQNTGRETVVTLEPYQRGNCERTYTKMVETPSKDTRKRRGLCQYLCTSVTSCLLSCLVVIPICVVLIRSRTNEHILVEEQPEPLRESPVRHVAEPFIGGETARVGRFELNQSAVFHDNKIRWLASSVSSSAGFHASEDDSCVSVPDSGLYHVISQLTFAFENDTVRMAGHSITSRQRGTIDESMIQKKLMSLPYRDPALNVHQKIYMPSNLLVFVEANAGDWVCVHTSDVDLVYASSVDNVLSIYKL
ncbi:uncharacterized protein LOC127833369 [Dreissena polymorpha]|uniref:TNF family profile domain-containing protein n=1 Tax=Dreissena polymorpha TaxID=45954 RepID=A0A9D4G5H0_DREPO|nr:uncharacterized protein LOC127833369 [Dreissena polymorpha]KAH3810751.1 hypothetical protein DPMN_139148 [Dreissena polymorpha]